MVRESSRKRRRRPDTSASEIWRRWLRLLSGLVGIWLFIFVLAPWLRSVGPVGEVLDCVRENDIDAAALFYTEVEACGMAELAVREAVRRQ